MNHQIAIIGSSCRLPGGITDSLELWQALKIGVNVNSRTPIDRIPNREVLEDGAPFEKRQKNGQFSGKKYINPVYGGNFLSEDIALFDHKFFKISRSEAEMIDPQQRILLESVQECIENSMLTDVTNVGVFIGLMEKEYPELSKSSSILGMLGSMASVVSGRVNYVFGCNGPSLTVDTACSSSLIALQLAVDALQSEKCSHAIVAGVNLIISEQGQGSRAHGGMLSSHGMCFSFDVRASGYGRSDGCVVLMLSLVNGPTNCMTIIEDISSNHCGRGISLTTPNGEAQKRLLESVGVTAGSTSERKLDFWEAHGTGTPTGDPIELNALASSLTNQTVGSVKSLLGHSEATAGVTSVLKLILMMQHNYVPRNLHFHLMNPKVEAQQIRIPIVGETNPLDLTGVSSFGVSGTNAVALLRKEMQKEAIPVELRHHLILLSAKNQDSLDLVENAYKNLLTTTSDSISNIVSALALHRQHYLKRKAFIVGRTGSLVLRCEIGKTSKIICFRHPLFELLRYPVISKHYQNLISIMKPVHAMKLAILKCLKFAVPGIQVVTTSASDFLLLNMAEGKIPTTEVTVSLLRLSSREVSRILKYEHEKISSSTVYIESEIDFMMFLGNQYIDGASINWSAFFYPCSRFPNLPNYQFIKQEIWFEKREKLLDHRLIGRLTSRQSDKSTFRNFINPTSKMDHFALLEALIEAVSNIQKGSFRLEEIYLDNSEGTGLWLTTEVTDDQVQCFINENLKARASIVEIGTIRNTQISEPSKFLSQNVPSSLLNTILKQKDNCILVDANHEVSSYHALLHIILSRAKIFSITVLGSLPKMFLMHYSQEKIIVMNLERQFLVLINITGDQPHVLNHVPPSRAILEPSRISMSLSSSSSSSSSTTTDVISEVKNILEDVISKDISDMPDILSIGFIDLGFDSLAIIDFLNRLNKKFVCELTTNDLFDYPNVLELSQKISDLQKVPECQINEESLEVKKILEILMQVVTEDFTDEELSEKGFFELGLDSLSLTEFVNRLNDSFQLETAITTSDVFNHSNVRDLSTFLQCSDPVNNAESESSIEQDSDEGGMYKLIYHPQSCDATHFLENQKHEIKLRGIYGSVNLTKHTKFDAIYKILSEESILKVNIQDSTLSVNELFQILINFVRICVRKDLRFRIAVSEKESWENMIARSFFKTISAETKKFIEFIWEEKLEKFVLHSPSASFSGCWLITGGLSGIGFETAKYLSENGASNVILMSRRQPSNELLLDLQTWKANVFTICVDVCDTKKMTEELQNLALDVTGVIHSAGVLQDVRFENQSEMSFSKVFRAKGEGLHSIETVFRILKYKIKYFVVMSSFSAAFGNEGQTNYASANAYIDYQMARRRKEGLPGTSIQWGNWRETGMASSKTVHSSLQKRGFNGLSTMSALKFFHTIIENNIPTALVANVNWQKVLRHRNDLPPDLLLAEINQFSVDEKSLDVVLEECRVHGNENIFNARISHRTLQSYLEGVRSKTGVHLNIRDVYRLESMRNIEYSTTSIIPIFPINVYFNDDVEFHLKKTDVLDSTISSEKKYALPVILSDPADVPESTEGKKRVKKSKLVMMFSGQGAQYTNMGRQLCQYFPVFRSCFTKCLSFCDKLMGSGTPLLDVIYDVNFHQKLQKTSIVQPLIFCFEYSLAHLWIYLGIVPDVFIGHSVGELVAGTLAGMIGLEDALRIVVERGAAMESVFGTGGMLAVTSDVAKDCTTLFDLQLASENSVTQSVLAGRLDQLQRAADWVTSKGKKATFVNKTYPFHSSLLGTTHLLRFRQCLEKVNFKTGHTDVVSNVTGKPIRKFSSSYLMKHAVHSVRFVDGIKYLMKENVSCWLEVGPRMTLGNFVKQSLPISHLFDHSIVSSIDRKNNDIEVFCNAALLLEIAGQRLIWPRFNNVTELDNFAQSTKISLREREILLHHKLNHMAVVAGAFQLYKMWTAALRKSSERFYLKDIVFNEPWWLEQDEMYRIEESERKLSMITSSGKKSWANVVEDTFSMTPLTCRSDMAEEVNIDDFYNQLHQNGLQYDSEFRVLSQLKSSSGFSLSTTRSCLPWVVIDGAMHTICASVLPKRPTVYFVPIRMDGFWIDETNLCKKLEVTTKITSENVKFIHVNVEAKSDGRRILAIENMTIVVKESDSQTQTNSRPEQIRKNGDKIDVFITGIHLQLPGSTGNCIHDIWDSLKSGRSDYKYQVRQNVQVKVNQLDIDLNSWDPHFFGIRPSEAPFIDPCQKLLMSSVAQLLHTNVIPENTGVFIGSSSQEFAHLVFKNSVASSEFSGGTSLSALAGRISHWLKVTGPSLVIDTACSSSFSALDSAVDALKHGKCVAAIVGTVNLILHDMTTEVLMNNKMIVSDSCKIFDSSADGYKRAEGVCTLLLTKNPDGSIATIVNSSAGHTGKSSSFYAPNGTQQAQLMLRSLNNFDVDEIEAHCTGTALGDPIELSAIQNVTKRDLYVSSIKSYVGHSEGASGLLALCLTLLQSRLGYRLPQKHLCCPKSQNSVLFRTIGEYSNSRSFLINNFGFTGTNLSFAVRVENFIDEREFSKAVFYLITFSSHKSELLELAKQEILKILEQSDQSIPEIKQRYQTRSYSKRDFLIVNYKRKVVEMSINPLFLRLHEDGMKFVKTGSDFVLNSRVFTTKLKLDSLYQASILDARNEPRKDVYYIREKTPKRITGSILFSLSKKVVGSITGLTSINMTQVDKENYQCLIFCAGNATKTEFLKLIDIWKRIPNDRLFVLCSPQDVTWQTQWTAAVRSLASEKFVKYKLIFYESIQNVIQESEEFDVFEAVHYKDGIRFVERLSKLKNVNLKTKTQVSNVAITGGTGGLGSEITKKLNCSSTSISRSSPSIKFDFATDKYFPAQEKNFDMFIHCAGVVDNKIHQKMQASDIDEVFDVKVNGIIKTEKFRETIPQTVGISSIACLLGSKGQSNYAFSNGVMTSLLEKEKAKVIHYGPLRNVGLLSHHPEIISKLEREGWRSMTSSDAVAVFSSETFENYSELLIADCDFNTIVNLQPHLKYYLSNVTSSNVLNEQISEKADDLTTIFKKITGIDPNPETSAKTFTQLGLDSLCLENLCTSIVQNLNLKISVADLFNNPTFTTLDSFLSTMQAKSIKLTQPTNVVEEPIAVIGYSAEFSGCEDVEEFWRRIGNGECCIHDGVGLLKSDLSSFDWEFFGVSKEEAMKLDSQICFFVQHAYKALETSGYVKDRSKLVCSVFASAEPFENEVPISDTMHRLFSMNRHNYLAQYTAYALDLKGEAVSVYTACSTALLAIKSASESLRAGKCDLALAGAASIATPQSFNSVSDEMDSVFSRSGVCKPFDENADGIVRGSGVGCFVLKLKSKALTDGDDILCTIDSMGTSNDGRLKNSFMAPNSSGQIACMRNALKSVADIDHIGYIECHATGTSIGDKIEMQSIKEVYESSGIILGSCKANIGHAFAASGIASILKAAHILREKKIPPQINYSYGTHNFNIYQISKPYNKKYVAVSSFGIGGTNAHFIIGTSPRNRETSPSFKEVLIPVSSKTEDGCRKNCLKLTEYLEMASISSQTLSSTLLNHREHHKYRAFAVGRSADEIKKQLMESVPQKVSATPKIAFFFSPQGSQYPNILPDLFEDTGSVFHQTIEELCAVSLRSGLNLRKVLLSDDGRFSIRDVDNSQVATFVQSIAIFRQLLSHGIHPEHISGHSLGEFTAVVANECLSMENMMQLLQERSKIISSTPDARMLLVFSRFETDLVPEIAIGAHLNDDIKCYVGRKQHIKKLEDRLVELKIKFKEIETTKGYHTFLLDDVIPQLRSLYESFNFSEPRYPWISCYDGKNLTSLTSEYLVQQTRCAVDINSIVNKLEEQKIDVVVEIGPPGMLQNLLMLRNSRVKVVQTCGSSKRPLRSLEQCLAELWSCGVEFTSNKNGFSSSVPTYTFDESNIQRKVTHNVRNAMKWYSPTWRPVYCRKKEEVSKTFKILEWDESMDYDSVIAKIKKQTRNLIIVMKHGDIEKYKLLGFIRYKNAFSTENRVVLVVHFGNTSCEDILHVVRNNINLDYFMFTPTGVFEQNFTVTHLEKPSSSPPKGIAVIFGDSGFVGKIYNTSLKNLGYKVFGFSKSTGCDITCADSVKSSLHQLQKTHLISIIINCAGVAAENQQLQNREASNVKIQGNLNILKALELLNVKVDAIVLISSLSSILPLYGNEDYTISNSFVNGLVEKGGVSKSICVLALPALIDSPMFKKSSARSQNMMKQCSLNQNGLQEIVMNSLFHDGLLVGCVDNPLDFSRKAIEQQRNVHQVAISEPEALRHSLERIWKDIFNINIEVLQEKSFFDLGGDSLTALQFSWRIKTELGYDVEVKDIFKYSTFNSLEQHLESMKKHISVEQPNFAEFLKKSEYQLPLSPSLRHMVILSEVSKPGKYNVAYEMCLTKKLNFDFKNLKYAFLSVVATQLAWRSYYKSNTENPRLIALSLTESYLYLNPKEIDDNVWKSLKKHHNFILSKTVPLRIMCRSKNQSIEIFIDQHHIITDGWSVSVLASKIADFYKMFVQKDFYFENSSFDYLVPTTHNDKLLSQLSSRLSQYTQAKIPQDRTFIGFPVHKSMMKIIPRGVIEKVKALGARLDVSVQCVLQVAFAKVVGAYCSQTKVVLPCAHSGRNEKNKEAIGYFMNTYFVVIDVNPDKSLVRLIEEYKTSDWEQFQSVPYIDIHKRMKKESDVTEISVFYNYRHSLDFPTVVLAEADVRIQQLTMNTAFDFSFTVDEEFDDFKIRLEYNSSAYIDDTVNTFCDDFLRTINQENGSATIIHGERTDFPENISIENSGNILFSESATTYKKAKKRIDQLSAGLSESFFAASGIFNRADDMFEVEDDMPTSILKILACFQIGATYVPIDMDWPNRRKNEIRSQIETITWYSESAVGQIYNKSTIYDTAYTIFTSGSTGKPKGVVMSRESVVSFTSSATKQCYFRSRLRIANSVKTAFDVSVSNIFGCVSNQATLLLYDTTLFTPSLLNSCQYAFLPSAVFNKLGEASSEHLQRLELLSVGGESIASANLKFALEKGSRVLQIYGPTETCVWSTTHLFKSSSTAENIGRPMENETMRIRGGCSRGELEILGRKKFRGYLNSKSASEAHFTGDIVKFNEDLFYCHRNDDQVKVRGNRVECREVEKIISSEFKGISRVLKIGNDLVAFTQYQVDPVEVRNHLKQLLPVYSIPTYIITVPDFKQNSSGKIDDSFLKTHFEISMRQKSDCSREPPRLLNSTTTKVLDIIESILNVKVDDSDNLIHIGGHSLSAIEISVRILEVFNVTISPHQILQATNFKWLVNLILKSLKESKEPFDTKFITALRETPGSRLNIYMIHAIGGTIYPYYSFLHIFPKAFSIYGIEFSEEYPVNSLKEIAEFYAGGINAHAGDKRIFLVGHSLGGILSREIASDLEMWGHENVFRTLPDYERRIERAMKLASFLRNYQPTLSDTQTYLFKSKYLGNASFTEAIRPDTKGNATRAMTFNGLDRSTVTMKAV